MSKVVFITGASSGIGKSIGEFLHRKGFTVFGTSRNPERIVDSVFPLVALDVRNKESIQNAIKTVIQKAIKATKALNEFIQKGETLRANSVKIVLE